MNAFPRHALVLTVSALLTSAAGLAEAQSLHCIGQQHLPTGFAFSGTQVGGLSGIDRNPLNGRYLAISDDRSGINPARYYEVSLDLAQFARSASPGLAGVTFNSVTTLLQPPPNAGLPYAANTLDPESIRINPATGELVWTNEGQRGGAGVPALQSPTVRGMAATGGVYTRDFAVPARYTPTGKGATDPGIRNNLAFESLTFSTDGNTLYTATENALVQDGLASAVGVGSPSRILSFNAATGAAGAEYIYPVSPVSPMPPMSPVVLAPVSAGNFATNGLVELLAIGDRQFVSVERSFSGGAATPGVGPNGLPTGNTIRLFYVDARAATDVSGFDLSSGVPYTAATKSLLLDLSDLRNDDNSPLALDNIEGITWGPDFEGKPPLILVSDNNFGATQFTQFLALSVTGPIPEPGTWLLLSLGLGAVVLRSRPSKRVLAV